MGFYWCELFALTSSRVFSVLILEMKIMTRRRDLVGIDILSINNEPKIGDHTHEGSTWTVASPASKSGWFEHVSLQVSFKSYNTYVGSLICENKLFNGFR